jgi:hypothetical protein
VRSFVRPFARSFAHVLLLPLLLLLVSLLLRRRFSDSCNIRVCAIVVAARTHLIVIITIKYSHPVGRPNPIADPNPFAGRLTDNDDDATTPPINIFARRNTNAPINKYQADRTNFCRADDPHRELKQSDTRLVSSKPHLVRPATSIANIHQIVAKPDHRRYHHIVQERTSGTHLFVVVVFCLQSLLFYTLTHERDPQLT